MTDATPHPGQLTRQQLYDRIRETSKDEFILDEMIRLGFWSGGKGQPSLPEEIIRRGGEIQRELRELTSKHNLWRDPERALKEMHKQRMRDAMQRRQETKARNAQKRLDRATAWRERRKTDVLYLGAGVSGGLSAAPGDRPLKGEAPQVSSVKALADAMGLPLAELRFLCFNRPVTGVHHYERFLLAKKTGGHRQISAPMPRLKRAQYWVLDNILSKFPLHEAAHGFAPGRSILTNAAPHVGRDVVVNLDLKDFFPTLTWRRVKGKFRGLGYSEPVATALALICTEPDVDEVELDGRRLFVQRGPRLLPQGAPTSPALTNLICSRLDARLSGLAAKLGFTYTRYADDMTFSASGEAAGKTGPLLKYVEEIVTAEGFTVHPSKTRVMRKGRRQEVTGLVVNGKVGAPREVLRKFRALLHQIDASGPDGKSWGRGGNVLLAAVGFAQFVRMVDAGTGGPLLEKAKALAARHGIGAGKAVAAEFRAKAAAGEAPLARWWTPGEPATPRLEPVLVQKKPKAQAAMSALDLTGMRRPETAAARPQPEARADEASGTAAGAQRRQGGVPWWPLVLMLPFLAKMAQMGMPVPAALLGLAAVGAWAYLRFK